MIKSLLFLIVFVEYANALVSWQFGVDGCSAQNNLNADNYEDKPMTILDWNSNHCWTDAVIPNEIDDVHIICDISCGLTGPVAIRISTNVTIKSLNIVISAPTKYFSLQISDFGMLQILLTFNGATDISSWFSLQIFPSSHLLLHDTCSFDGSVFNGGTITAPRKRVLFYVFYVEMCGNYNASLINVDIISIMGARNSSEFQQKRFKLLFFVNSATQTEVAAVTNFGANTPNIAPFKNVNACEDTNQMFLRSYVPGVFFSGAYATLINSTITVISESSFPTSMMMIFNHSFQAMFGENCNFKVNGSIIFQNGPRAIDVLSISCSLESLNLLQVSRPVKLQQMTNLHGTKKLRCMLNFAVGQFLSNAVNGMLIVQNSLTISMCTSASIVMSSSNFKPNFALILINQTHEKNAYLSINDILLLRQNSPATNAAALADMFFYSCAEVIDLGTMVFLKNTIFAWSCRSTLLKGAFLDFSGQLLNFVDMGISSALLDPMNMFNVTISPLYHSKVVFQGNRLHIEFNTFIMGSGLILIGTDEERHSHEVSFVSFKLELKTSSITLLRSAVVTAGVALIRGISNIYGVFIVQMLELQATSTSSGNGMICIKADGYLSMHNISAQLQPALHANKNSTIPDVMQIGGDLSCDSCNIGNSNNQQSKLISSKQIRLRDVNSSKSLSLIASSIMIENVVLGNLDVHGLYTICSGLSQISDLKFTNEFRVLSGSSLQVIGVTFINNDSFLNIAGEFHGNVAYVKGNIYVEMQSKSYFDVMELLSSANIIVSGVLKISHFTSDCVESGCKLIGNGSFSSYHFEIKPLSQLLIDTLTVSLFGIFLQQGHSELFVTSTSIYCSSVNGGILGDFITVNTSLYISQDSHFDLNCASLRLYSSNWSVFGSIVADGSILDADVASEIVLSETSRCHFENSIIGSKHITMSGSSNICKNSTFFSDLTLLNNISISQCRVTGNVFLEKESVMTILPNTVWGLNVTETFHILGRINVLLNDSLIIGYSFCVWANAHDLSAMSSVTTDGIPKQNINLELKNDCVQLTHMGCPPGNERLAGGTCELCHSGYHNYRYNSICSRCPKGMVAVWNRTTCKFCDVGSFLVENSTYNCMPCISGAFCNATGLSKPSGFCAAGTYNPTPGAVSIEACRQCPSGYYQNLEGQEACKLCESGTYTDKNGSTQCMACPAGKYCLDGCSRAHGDGVCPAGTYSILGTGKSFSCTHCDAGTYNVMLGSTMASACLPCPAGAYCLTKCNSSIGNGFCVAGTYSAVGSGVNSSCMLCPEGRNCMPGCTSSTGSTLCEPCESGSFFDENQTKCQPCPPGMFKNESKFGARCEICHEGWVANNAGSKTCTKCPNGYTSSSDRILCLPCSPTTHLTTSSINQTECFPCTVPNLVLDDMCVDPFNPGSSFYAANVSLFHRNLNASVLNVTLVKR